jgi:hypothetical protein
VIHSHTWVIGYRASQSAPRKSARTQQLSPWNAACCVLGVMDIVHLAFMVGPLLGAAAGYLVDGVTGATSGFVIPMGPLVLVWLFGGR